MVENKLNDDFSAVAVYSNCISTASGTVLVVFGAFMTDDRDAPIYVTVYKLDFTPGRAHTKLDIDRILDSLLPGIAADFPSAEKFLVRDGSSVNTESGRDQFSKNFKCHKQFKSIYCLFHLLAARTHSILACARKKAPSYSFRNEDDEVISVGKAFGKEFSDLQKHLLKGPMGIDMTVEVLSEMARTDESHRLWTCLETTHLDPGYNTLQTLLLGSRLYRAVVRGGTTTATKRLFEKYTDHVSHRFQFKEGARALTSWSTASRNTLQYVTNCTQDFPLIFFTLCFDEHLKSAAKKYASGALHPSVSSRPVTFESIQKTLEILYKQPITRVHSNYGEIDVNVVVFKLQA